MRIIPLNLNGDFSEALYEALAVLKKGGVVVFPTDTVYGIGANACDWYAVEQIFKIKKKAADQADFRTGKEHELGKRDRLCASEA